jgi:hypothetical protein
VSIVASALIGVVCFTAAAGISNFMRGFLIAYRPELTLPASTAFVFAHWRLIRYVGYAVAAVVLVAGIASVRRAPDSELAMRRALLFSIFSSVVSSVVLFAVLVCSFQPFVVVIIMQSPR